MAENTKIEWTDHTFNPWEGCQKVGPGCDNCYAETRNARYAGGQAINWGAGAPRRRTSASNWNKPLKWNANHEAFFKEHGRRQRVFCASLADVFDNAVNPQWRADLFKLIAATPMLDWLLLTKRIGNAYDMIHAALWDLADPANTPHNTTLALPTNVWIGATIVNQEEADRDIPKLLAVPAKVRFLSMEPLLGPVNLVPYLYNIHLDIGEQPVDWVIVGGESGPAARPIHPDWVRSLRDQCFHEGTPFLFKQWGEWLPQDTGDASQVSYVSPAGAVNRYRPVDPIFGHEARVVRVGKKAAGRLLDGRTWDEFPANT